jgi:chemotaxis signal transduction protein
MIVPKLVEPPAADVLNLLERRAQRAKARTALGVEEAVVWVAEFSVGEEKFAVPLASLRAAVPLRTVTPVPLSPPEVIGVLRFQGEIITALSLASLLGVRGWRDDPAVLIIVDRGGGQKVALDCEQIPKPVALSSALVEAARANAGTAPWAEVVGADKHQVNLIDVARLLANRRKEG